MASEVMDLYLHVRTPVHVGGAQEKHLSGGIDYLVQRGMIHVLNHKKLMQLAGQEQYVNALSKGAGGIRDLIKGRQIDIEAITESSFSISGNANDYRSMAKDGFKGRPYIPGSSIKGAIRSILFHYLFNKENESRKEEWLEQAATKKIKGFILDKNILGEFEGSLMRFIHCSDVYYDQVSLVNTKVFNLNKPSGQWKGAWKHEFNGGNDNKFRPSGFTTAYEVLPIGSVAKIRLKFDRDMFEKYNEKKPPHAKQLPLKALALFREKTFKDVLLELISDHTKKYINSEKAFFNKYSVDETDLITEQLAALEVQNYKEHPLFRLASGSGFHSITGDWRFEDHLQTIEEPDLLNSSKRYPDGSHYKSRRLAFETDEEGNYLFYPMGFVQLITPEYFERNLMPKIEAERAKAAELRRQAEEAERLRLEEEKRKAEEASRPMIRTLQQVKKEGIVDAEVLGQKGKQVQVKVFIEGYENKVLEARYPAGFQKGTIVQIKAKVQKKQIQFVGAPRQKK